MANERDPRPETRQPVDRNDLRDVPVQPGSGGAAGKPGGAPSHDLLDGGAPRTLGVTSVPADAIKEVAPKTTMPESMPSSGARPATADVPTTTEKPGTGMRREPPNDFPYTREKEPVPGQQQRYPPRPERERPTGQITDESGEYGPERTWYDGDGETDWNKVNRAPALKRARARTAVTPRATGLTPAALIIGGAVVLGAALGVLNRPPTVGATAATPPSAVTNAANQTYDVGPLKVVRDTNSTTSRYTIDVFLVPPGEFKWTLDAPCGDIGATQLSALVGWSYDNNTKTCPPGRQGPFPGKVILTFTSAKDGKVYTWTAGSETGSYGEKVTIR